MNRTQMISICARQLERYRDLTMAWSEQRMAAKAVVLRAERELVRQDEELTVRLAAKEQVIDTYKKKLGAMYRGMCGKLDAMREEKTRIERELVESVQNEAEMTAFIEELEGKNRALKITLDKTMTKLNEVQEAYDATEAECEENRHANEIYINQAPELSKLLNQITLLAQKKEALDAQHQKSTVDLVQLQDDLGKERAHALRLEGFIRRIATGRAHSIRTGGGYILDAKAKREAAALIKDASKIVVSDEPSGFDATGEGREIPEGDLWDPQKEARAIAARGAQVMGGSFPAEPDSEAEVEPHSPSGRLVASLLPAHVS